MIPILTCPVCCETERTIIAEYNRLIFLDAEWQSDLARYDYALCHGCGLVHPTRRPERREYEYLYANFNEFLLREGRPNRFNVPEMTPKLQLEIDRQFVPWQDLEGTKLKGYPIRRRLRRELDAARVYLAQITGHMSLAGAKILHLRAKSSVFAQCAKEAYGAAQTDVVTLFPAHQYLAEKNPGIRVATDLDYHDFRIPFADKYDLILENHILVHMLDPNKTFSVFRSHLAEGGAIFLRGELADDILFRNGKNLFSELRPFHFNQFDKATLERMLHRYGFDPVSIVSGGEEPELTGLVRLVGAEQPCPRIGAAELRQRLDMYRAWRDESILSLPRQRAAALFGSELPRVWQRVRRKGRLTLGVTGTPRALRKIGELNLPIEALEIGRLGGWRRRLWRWTGGRIDPARVASWVASRPHARRAAVWLAGRYPRTRLGTWLKYRLRGASTLPSIPPPSIATDVATNRKAASRETGRLERS